MADIKAVVGHFVDARGRRVEGGDDLIETARSLQRGLFPRIVVMPEDGRTSVSVSVRRAMARFVVL